MKKSIIAAGAASAVLAAMPIAGVFAVDFTDTLNLTIDNVCTFTRQTVAHTDGVGAWGNDGKEETTNDAADTLYATVTNGTVYDGETGNSGVLGSSAFNVTCNNNKGYSVAVNASALTATGVSTTDFAWPYAAGGTLTTNTDASSWTISSNGEGAAMNTGTVATKGAPTNGTNFTVTYKAFVDSTQPAGTYTATAEYTMTQLNS